MAKCFYCDEKSFVVIVTFSQRPSYEVIGGFIFLNFFVSMFIFGITNALFQAAGAKKPKSPKKVKLAKKPATVKPKKAASRKKKVAKAKAPKKTKT